MQSWVLPLLVLMVLMVVPSRGRESENGEAARSWKRPAITPRSALPVIRGSIAHVEPNAACPPDLGKDAVRLGAGIIDPPLLDYVEPDMPAALDLLGMVIIEVRIAPDGRVTPTKPLRGDPRLGAPVIAAARRWRYARTCLNGNPIPLIKTITMSLVQ
jgi:hypothetical protein